MDKNLFGDAFVLFRCNIRKIRILTAIRSDRFKARRCLRFVAIGMRKRDASSGTCEHPVCRLSASRDKRIRPC